MTAMFTTVTRVRRAIAAEIALAMAAAIVCGFVLGFVSQAFGAEGSEPVAVLDQAAASLDEQVVSLASRNQRARDGGDERLARCIGEHLGRLRGGHRALQHAADDQALALLRGDEEASILALRRGDRALKTADRLLADALACASTVGISSRANGITVLAVQGPSSPEDEGFGPPNEAPEPLGRR